MEKKYADYLSEDEKKCREYEPSKNHSKEQRQQLTDLLRKYDLCPAELNGLLGTVAYHYEIPNPENLKPGMSQLLLQHLQEKLGGRKGIVSVIRDARETIWKSDLWDDIVIEDADGN